jgi:hypothetical protein
VKIAAENAASRDGNQFEGEPISVTGDVIGSFVIRFIVPEIGN